MNIMLLDDHELFSLSLEYLLKDAISTYQYFSKEEALFKELAEMLPDILLLDINLKVGTGLDVGKRVLEKYPDLKITFLSGYDLEEYQYQAHKMGARGFIRKDLGPSELLPTLKAICEGKMFFPELKLSSYRLTHREIEVLELSSQGKTHKAIADELFVHSRTVANHCTEIRFKLGVNSMPHAIRRAIELGILSTN
ncbi:MAG: response regulator transcription factor [Turicibacter sp.]|nr:response regulator transcription factor [Turicibacter sp.]